VWVIVFASLSLSAKARSPPINGLQLGQRRPRQWHTRPVWLRAAGCLRRATEGERERGGPINHAIWRPRRALWPRSPAKTRSRRPSNHWKLVLLHFAPSQVKSSPVQSSPVRSAPVGRVDKRRATGESASNTVDQIDWSLATARRVSSGRPDWVGDNGARPSGALILHT